MDNPTPQITAQTFKVDAFDYNDDQPDILNENEVFQRIAKLADPEHPALSLAQLNVVQQSLINIKNNIITVKFVPTIPHCIFKKPKINNLLGSMATLIGLSIKVLLLNSMPAEYKVDVFIKKGAHVSEVQVNRQLNDKERVNAALENPHLLKAVNQCIAGVVV